MQYVYDICIPDSQYDEFMQRVMALPERKRSKWHDTICDKNGVRTRIQYKNGQLMNWSLKSHSWGVVNPARYIAAHKAEMVNVSEIGRVLVEEDHDAFLRAICSAIHYNQTGNHKSRPHHVKVASRADGTLRA